MQIIKFLVLNTEIYVAEKNENHHVQTKFPFPSHIFAPEKVDD